MWAYAVVGAMTTTASPTRTRALSALALGVLAVIGMVVAFSLSSTLVIAGGETDGRWLGGSDRQLRALVLSRFIDQKLTTFVASENHEDLLVLKDLIEAGKVTPVIDRTFTLGETADAIRYLEQGRAQGKVAITV